MRNGQLDYTRRFANELLIIKRHIDLLKIDGQASGTLIRSESSLSLNRYNAQIYRPALHFCRASDVLVINERCLIGLTCIIF